MNNKELIAILERAAKANPDIDGNHTKIAELAGMHQATVSRMFSGENDPQLSNVLKIAEAIKVRVILTSDKVVGLHNRPESRLDSTLLGQYLEKMDIIFPEFGLNNLTWYQKTALAKIGYDSHFGKQAPDEKTVSAEVIQWAQAYRASGGS